MGTPDRFHEAETDMLKGLVYARNLKNKQKAIFLDRDGTINKLAGFVTNPEQFELIQDVTDAIKLINKSGYLAIVVTNQPVIARGDCTFEELQTIHDKMETELGKRGLLLMQYMYVLITRTRGLKVNDLNISVTVIVGNRSRDYFYRQLKTLI